MSDPENPDFLAAQCRPRPPGRDDPRISRLVPSPQRLECCFRGTNFTYEAARGAIGGQHPDWTAEKVEREIGRRITGIDVETLRRGPSPCRGAR